MKTFPDWHWFRILCFEVGKPMIILGLLLMATACGGGVNKEKSGDFETVESNISPECQRAQHAIQPFLDEFDQQRESLQNIDLTSQESKDWGLDSAKIPLLFMKIDGYRLYSPFDGEIRRDWVDSVFVVNELEASFSPEDHQAFVEMLRGQDNPLIQWVRGELLVTIDYGLLAEKYSEECEERAFFGLMDSISTPTNDNYLPPWLGFNGMTIGPYALTGEGEWTHYRHRFSRFADNEYVGEIAAEYLEYLDNAYLNSDHFSGTDAETLADFQEVLQDFPNMKEREVLEARLQAFGQ